MATQELDRTPARPQEESDTEATQEMVPGPPAQQRAPIPQPPPSQTTLVSQAKEGEPDKADKQDDEKQKGRFHWVVIGIGVVMVVFLVVGLIPRLRAKPRLKTAANRQSEPAPLQVAYPSVGPGITTLTLPGNIQAVQSTDISARTSGYVSKWMVDIGDQVKAGQVLAILSTPDVDQQEQQARAQYYQSLAVVTQQQAEEARAQATLEQSRQNARKQEGSLVQAQADLSLALVTWKRWLDMVREGAVSQQAADEKQAAYNNNKANVSSLQAALAASASDITASEAGVRSAQANVRAARAQAEASLANLKHFTVERDFKKVRAPFSGVITARMIDEGALIGGGASSSGSSGASSSGSSGGGSGGSSGASAKGAASAQANSNGGGSATGGGGGSRTTMYNSASDSASGGATAMNNTPAGASSGGMTPGAATGSRSSTTSTGSAGGSTTGGGAEASAQQIAQGRGGAANPSNTGQANSSVGTTAAAPLAPAMGGGTNGQGGTLVSPGMSLFTLARIDVLRIQVNVPQTFTSTIKPGQHARLTLSAGTGRQFEGTVTRTASALDPTTRTMLTEVQIKNTDKALLPGMYAQTVFRVARSTQPLLIPAGALIYDAGGTQVATVGNDKKVHLIPVIVGRDYGPSVEIDDAQGINSRTLVVTSPTLETKEGVPAPKTVFSSTSSQAPGSQATTGGNSTPGDASGGQGGGKGKQDKSAKGGDGKGVNSGGGGGQAKSHSGPPPNVGATYGGADTYDVGGTHAQ